MGVPVQAEALEGVAVQLNLRVELTHRRGLKSMLCAIKDEDPTVNAEGRNDVRVLRLIAGLVDLTRMLNLVDNVALDGSHISRLAVAANLATIIIIIIGVGRRGLGDLDVGDLQVVWAVVRRVSAQEEAVRAVVGTLGLLYIREPLDGQGWPGEGLA